MMDTKNEKGSPIEALLREKAKLEKSIAQFSQVVTIMFTDIAGYTRFVETHGDVAAKTLLFTHNEMVFDCIKVHRGHIIKTIGDAVMASFADPLDAVTASTAVQNALRAYNKTAEPQKQINIRIGLNTGKAIEDNGDYFGDAVNVAARIESAGAAGQILVSQSVFDAVKENKTVLVRYHGQKEVKGKSDALLLYRVFSDRDELIEAESAEKEALKLDGATDENAREEDGPAEHGKGDHGKDADFSSQWQDEAGTKDDGGELHPSPSQVPVDSSFEAIEPEEETSFVLSKPVHRFDLIWKLSLPIMVMLGALIYFYPQLMPGERSGTLLNQYIQAFNHLRAGDVERARDIFLGFGEDNPKCQEGLAAIAYRRSAYDKAKAFCDRSIAADGEVFYPRVIKGNIFFDKGKTDQAREVYTEALKYSSPLEWQKGELYFRLGRLSSLDLQPEKALEYYDKAMNLDRSNPDIVTAKGVVLEKMGDLDSALTTYDAALKMDPDHPMANAFYRQIKRNMEAAENKEKQARINALVSDLIATMEKRKANAENASRSHSGEDGGIEKSGAIVQDLWSSKPVTLFFSGRERSEAFSLRENEDLFFELVLLESLGNAPNISLVDRALLDKLFEELKLGASELADESTRLKLGRLVSARLIGRLTFVGHAGETTIFLELIETETTAVKIRLSETVGKEGSPDVLAETFAKRIINKVSAEFPIRGRIAEISGSEVMLNIGTTHGVTPGMVMRVFPGEAVENSLKRKSIGAVKVTEVMADSCRGEIVKGKDVMDTTDVVEAFSS